MIILIISSIADFKTKPFFSIKIKKNIKNTFIDFFRAKDYLVITLFFILVLISGINSHDIREWNHHLLLKLPFLLLPFAFFSLKDFDQNKYFRIYYYFIVLMFLSTIPVIFNYLTHKIQYDELIMFGQIIPTPIDHIKYSLLLAFSILVSLIFIFNNYKIRYEWEKYIFGFIAISNLITLHILAVRSGIVVFYITISVILLKTFWNKSKSKSVFILLLLFIFPIISYYSITSFRNKINYMIYDYKMYKDEKGDSYSDSGRIYSIKVGIQLIQENPIIGTGIGDLKNECKKTYSTMYPNKNIQIKYPHNQYIFTLSGSGLIGLFLFLTALLYPLFSNKRLRNDLFLISFMTIMFVSFFVENTLERSYSVGFYLFFVLIALNYAKAVKKN